MQRKVREGPVADPDVGERRHSGSKVHQIIAVVGDSSPGKNFKFKVAIPLKFNSDSLSYSTENCRRLFPVRMIFTSLMTLKVKNKTWISNFQVHLQAETNL